MLSVVTLPVINNVEDVVTDGVLMIDNATPGGDSNNFRLASLNSNITVKGCLCRNPNSPSNGVLPIVAAHTTESLYYVIGYHTDRYKLDVFSTITNGWRVSYPIDYDSYFLTYNSGFNYIYGLYESIEAAYTALGIFDASTITYRLTNCSAPSAPESANSGDTVSVNFVPVEGYGFITSSDVYVTNNGVVIPSTLSGNTLTFTMP